MVFCRFEGSWLGLKWRWAFDCVMVLRIAVHLSWPYWRVGELTIWLLYFLYSLPSIGRVSGGRLMRVIFWQLKFVLLCGGVPPFHMGAY